MPPKSTTLLKVYDMLGVRCKHDPISGKYADEMMKHIISMTVNPTKVDKSSIKLELDWSEVN